MCKSDFISSIILSNVCKIKSQIFLKIFPSSILSIAANCLVAITVSSTINSAYPTTCPFVIGANLSASLNLDLEESAPKITAIYLTFPLPFHIKMLSKYFISFFADTDFPVSLMSY